MQEGVEEVKEGVKKHFEKRFKKLSKPGPRLQGIEFNRLFEDERVSLEEKFSREEIQEVVFSSEGDRIPGPDGYNLEFIKKCWDIVGNKIIQCIQDFHEKATLPSAMLASFIALIPKVEHHQGLEEFRPICLIGCIYKIISKVLVRRLRKVIGKLT